MSGRITAAVVRLASALRAAAGSSLLGFVQAGAGAVAGTVQGELRRVVVVSQFGSVGDGVADDAPAFARAAARAAEIGGDVYVPEPAVSYRLDTDPAIPRNVDLIASPHWFSGVGKLPIHKYMELSEGVDARIYHGKDWHMSEPPANNGERFWTGQHAVNIVGDQAYTGADSVKQDCVGHGTRAYVRGKNGRGWGGVDLGAVWPESLGDGALDTSIIVREIDLNNNAQDVNDFDIIGGLRAKGLLVMSGGQYRPEEAIAVGSTSYENRWLAALRVKKDGSEFGVIVDEGYTGPAYTVPKSSKVMFAKANLEKAALRLTEDEKGVRFTGNTGADALLVSEGETNVRGALLVASKAQAGAIDAAKTNLVVITGNTAVSTITNGKDGQELMIVVGAGNTCTLNSGGNLKLAGGASIGLAGAASITFIYTDGFWWQKSAPVGGLA